MDALLSEVARRAIGFMPEDEGLALYRAGLLAARVGPLLEIGSYCGKSAVYLGAAAHSGGTVLYSIDHHRGSEEHQCGEEYHDPRVVDPGGRVDTLPQFLGTLHEAGLTGVVLPIVARSEELGRAWQEPVGLVFIDGGHAASQVAADYEAWAPHVRPAGLLAIHDVFVDPADGGRAPYEVYRRALQSRAFEEISATGSLRVLQRVRDDV